MSGVAGLGEGSEGIQWAVEGVFSAGEGASETIVQWHVVRVGAAWDGDDTRAAVSRNGVDVEKSMIALCSLIDCGCFVLKRICLVVRTRFYISFLNAVPVWRSWSSITKSRYSITKDGAQYGAYDFRACFRPPIGTLILSNRRPEIWTWCLKV